MKKRMALLLAAVAVVLFCGAWKMTEEPPHSPPDETYIAKTLGALVPVPQKFGLPENIVQTATIKAVGDDLIHNDIYNYGEAHGSDYSFMFEHIKNEIQNTDLAIINQETILIADKSRLSSYPTFGSPVEIAAAIQDAGFDAVTLATNHCMDQGLDGIHDSIDAFSSMGQITYLGVNKNQAESDVIKIVEKNGIRFAMLNYTYSTNGIPIPSDCPYCVDTFNNKEKVISDIQRAEKMADVTIVFPHWGTEYSHTPDSFQQEWTQIFLDNGVDIVIGTHPHVVQPFGLLQSDTGRQMLIYYSLGNFISSQGGADKVLGGMADITVQKDKDGIHFVNYDLVPIVTHQSHGFFTTYLLKDYTPELAARHRAGLTVNSLNNLFAKNISIS